MKKSKPVSLIKKVDRLDAEEERVLARRWKTSQDPKLLNRLVEPLLGLVVKIASEFRHAGPPIEDLVQEGNLGLLIAVRKFDPERGVRLSTYATWWVRARMIEYTIRTHGPVRFGTTRAERRIFFGIGRARRRLDFLGKEASSENLARLIDVDADDIERVASRISARDVELDAAPFSANDISRSLVGDSYIEERIADGEEANTQRESLAMAMERLNERERTVLTLRFSNDEPRTLAEIGAMLNLSRERVRQIEARALDKLRSLITPPSPSSPLPPLTVEKSQEPAEARKESHLRVRLAESHLGEIKAAADKAGISISAWVVERLLKAAR